MKDQLNPMLFWGIVGLLVIGVVVFIVIQSRSTFKPATTGSEATMKKVKQTGVFYQPPPGAPVPGGVR